MNFDTHTVKIFEIFFVSALVTNTLKMIDVKRFMFARS